MPGQPSLIPAVVATIVTAGAERTAAPLPWFQVDNIALIAFR
jgi:hypothetical protein